MPLPQTVLFDVSFPEKLLKIVATRGEIFSLKFTKYRLAAGLCPDPLGELKRSPDPLAAIRGSTSKRKGAEGREGKGGKGGREREERGGKGRRGEGNGKMRGDCLKFTKYRLAAGLRPDPLGELKRSPKPLGGLN